MELIGRHPDFLPPAEKAKAQAMMRELKERFAEDCEVSKSVRRCEQMTAEEADFYNAVVKASTCIQARSNTDPISSNWHGELYSCHIDIAHYLRHGLGMAEEETDP